MILAGIVADSRCKYRRKPLCDRKRPALQGRLSPDGYVLSSESVPTFEFEGERLSYSASRDVDYQNEDLNIGIFYTGSGFTAGTYQVQIYCDGFLIGSIELPMR